MIKRYQTILAVIGLIIAMGIADGMEREDEQRQATQYCEMVQLWKQSGGKRCAGTRSRTRKALEVSNEQ